MLDDSNNLITQALTLNTPTNPYFCKIIYENVKELHVPVIIQLCDGTGRIISSVTFDAVDSVDFPAIDLSEINDVIAKYQALEALQLGLTAYGPMKGLALVHENDASLFGKMLNYADDPFFPPEEPGLQSIKKLCFAYAKNSTMREKIDADDKQLMAHTTNYIFRTNNDESHKRDLYAQYVQFSELLMHHSGWVNPSDPSSRIKYGPVAMQLRLRNPNVTVFALYDINQPHDPIGFARLHKTPEHDHYYFGDFVIHKNYRGKKLGTLLLNYVMRNIPEGALITLIAGGSELARGMYKKLGFIPITEHSQKGQKVFCGSHYLLMSRSIKLQTEGVLQKFKNNIESTQMDSNLNRISQASMLGSSLAPITNLQSSDSNKPSSSQAGVKSDPLAQRHNV